MKKCLLLVLLLGVIVGCEDPKFNQPQNSEFWKPYGKTYVAEDDTPSAILFKDWQLYFTNDTLYYQEDYLHRSRYSLKYPYIYLYSSESHKFKENPSYMFIDTLTIVHVSTMRYGPSRYKLVR